MCNQYYSSKVVRYLKELSKKYTGLVRVGQSRLFDSENFDVNFDLSQMPNWGDKKEVWATVEKMLPHLEVISFAGGEPTLIEGVSYVLQRCVETNNARHIKVFFSSNFMQMPRLYIDLAPHFKCFEFIASIDGYGPIQEYIRHP